MLTRCPSISDPALEPEPVLALDRLHAQTPERACSRHPLACRPAALDRLRLDTDEEIDRVVAEGAYAPVGVERHAEPQGCVPRDPDLGREISGGRHQHARGRRRHRQRIPGAGHVQDPALDGADTEGRRQAVSVRGQRQHRIRARLHRLLVDGLRKSHREVGAHAGERGEQPRVGRRRDRRAEGLDPREHARDPLGDRRQPDDRSVVVDVDRGLAEALGGQPAAELLEGHRCPVHHRQERQAGAALARRQLQSSLLDDPGPRPCPGARSARSPRTRLRSRALAARSACPRGPLGRSPRTRLRSRALAARSACPRARRRGCAGGREAPEAPRRVARPGRRMTGSRRRAGAQRPGALDSCGSTSNDAGTFQGETLFGFFGPRSSSAGWSVRVVGLTCHQRMESSASRAPSSIRSMAWSTASTIHSQGDRPICSRNAVRFAGSSTRPKARERVSSIALSACTHG